MAIERLISGRYANYVTQIRHAKTWLKKLGQPDVSKCAQLIRGQRSVLVSRVPTRVNGGIIGLSEGMSL